MKECGVGGSSKKERPKAPVGNGFEKEKKERARCGFGKKNFTAAGAGRKPWVKRGQGSQEGQNIKKKPGYPWCNRNLCVITTELTGLGGARSSKVGALDKETKDFREHPAVGVRVKSRLKAYTESLFNR